VNTSAVLDALIRHYRKPGTERDGEVLIPEPQAPGSMRRCDLLRVGMWASRGTGIDVHEIKVSRSDWLRELDDPAKAEAWWPYCNRFWLVAPPGIVAAGELPKGWGLLEIPASGRRFKVRTKAASKEARLTVALLIELLRRADNQRLGEMDQLRSQHRDDLREAQREWRLEQAQREIPYEIRERLKLLEKVEAVIGLKLDKWEGWPALPPTNITPAELGAFLSDCAGHVTAQRRAGQAERARAALEKAANVALNEARKIAEVPSA
jgi:hypothetical protein